MFCALRAKRKVIRLREIFRLAMTMQNMDTAPGFTLRSTLVAQALLDREDKVWLPYDKSRMNRPDRDFRPLSASTVVNNAHLRRFRLDYGGVRRLLIINGMGVALGDSLIGISVLMWLLRRHPALRMTLWRSSTAPAYVEEAYQNLSPRLQVEYLPRPLSHAAEFDTVIDLSDFMFRPDFDRMSMIDFFVESLGIDAAAIPASEKANGWIATAWSCPVPAEPYVLFCPRSSASLRSIPEACHAAMIERLWRRSGLPVKGFSSARHPAFQDCTAASATLGDFARLIGGARHVVSTDSAAVHLAAGFAIPTTAFFISIPSRMRVRDYPACTGIDLEPGGPLAGLHASNNPDLLRHAHALWGRAIHCL